MQIRSPSFLMLLAMARTLRHLNGRVVYVGGATVALLVSDPAAPEVRVTDDIDVVVEVQSLIEFNEFESEICGIGFENDMSGGFIGRYRLGDQILDIIPPRQGISGPTNSWYEDAIAHSTELELERDLSIRAISAPYFLATKLEAFRRRGNNDLFASRDFEDIITVVDGRPELTSEIRDTNVRLRDFLAKEFTELLARPIFHEAIAAHLQPDEASQQRQFLIYQTIVGLAAKNQIR